ncbi:MAG: DMT family transporter [Pseudomonadota bacterium]
MSVPAAYLGLILIWSTTPLAIKWSGQDVGFLFGVTGRMLLGAVVCLALIRLLRVELPWHRAAVRTYLAAGIGIYGSMLCVYWGAQYIPSGLIAVLFGLTPLVTGALAMAWLGERSFTPGKLAGIAAGLTGLVMIFGGGSQQGPLALQGICAVLVSVVLHSISSVRVKLIGAEVPALAVTSGGLLVAMPLYLATWWLVDGVVPRVLPARVALSIVYLGVVGSVIGFVLYYYVLKRLSAGRVALITLVTPVTALLLGNVLNDERPGLEVWAGTVVILLGLVLYQREARVQDNKPVA